MKKLLPLILLLGVGSCLEAITPRVFLAGKDARLQSTLALSDGSILAGGSSGNLDWLPSSARKIPVAPTAGNGWSLPIEADNSRQAFVLHLSPDLGEVLSVLVFPPGTGGGIFAIKTDGVPGEKTGALYLSGASTDQTKYWLAKLDGNFLEQSPSGLLWGYDKDTNNGGKIRAMAEIWDVGGDGKIVFYNYRANDWGVLCRLKADGSGLDSVPQWRNSHGSTQPDGTEAKILSLKVGNGCMRSRTWEEYNALMPDGNGGLRKGKFPDDLYFAGPIEAGNDRRGYTGYSPKNTAASSVAVNIDRRTNAIYLGYNVQSILPPWNDLPNAPDFEPTVVAFTADGEMRWWSRLYSEISMNSGPFVSVDGGVVWTRLGEGYIYGAARGVTALDKVLFVAENNGLSRLRPGGSWETLNVPLRPATAVASGGGAVFVGGSEGRIMKSTDLGETWKPAGSGLPTGKKSNVTVLAVSPRQSDRVFAGVSGGGLFLSENGGASWSPIPTFSGGEDIVDLEFMPGNPDTMLALTRREVLISSDAGATWAGLSVPPGASFTAMAIDPANPANMFVSSFEPKGEQAMRVSTDGGKTWSLERVGNLKVLDVIATSAGVFCASADRGIFQRVSDGKNDWTRLNQAEGLEKATGGASRILEVPGLGIVAFGNGAGNTSSPDQYVDGLAVDYSQSSDAGEVVVFARAHGNNVTNLWSGLEGKSFMRRQTGTRGNEHYHWIGRLKAKDGSFVNATWFVGMDPFGKGFAKPYEDPNLAGWPDHNGGNANLKGAQGRALMVAKDGRVAALGTTRAAITTANAFQKMTSPLEGGAPWHDFLRVHSADLSTVSYATALTGQDWDTIEGKGAENTTLTDVTSTPGGSFVVVGYHHGTGNPMPTANVPAWGTSVPSGESMILALLP